MLHLLITAVIMFYFLQGAWHYRPVSDDLYFANNVRESGFVDSFLDSHQNKRVTSRAVWYTAYLIASGELALNRVLSIFMIVIHSLVFLSLFTTITYAVKVIRADVSIYRRMGIAAVLMFLCYLMTSNPQEVWFWFSGAGSYLLILVFLGPIVAAIANFNSLRGVVLLYISALLLGGIAENTVLFVAAGTAIFVISTWSRWRKTERIKITGALLMLVVPILYGLLEGGYAERMAFELTQTELNSSIPLEGVFDSWKRLVLIFICLLFLLAQAEDVQKGMKPIPSAIRARYIVGALSIAAIVALLPLPMIFQSLAPSRAFFPFDLSMVVVSLLVVLRVVRLRIFKEVQVPFFKSFAGILLCTIVVYAVLSTYPVAERYARAYDERIDYLKDANPDKHGKILVRPLPDSGIITSQEVANCKSQLNATSRFLCPSLGKKCVVCLEPKNQK